MPTLAGRDFAFTPAQAGGSDAVVKATTWHAATGAVTVPARSVAVLVDAQPQNVGTVVIAKADRLLVRHGSGRC